MVGKFWDKSKAEGREPETEKNLTQRRKGAKVKTEGDELTPRLLGEAPEYSMDFAKGASPRC